VLLGHPGDEAGRGGLADHQPALLARAVLGRVEHDRLAGAAGARVQRRAARRARAILKRLDEVLEHVLAADQ